MDDNLGLADNDFWHLSEERSTALVLRLAKQRKPALFLAAPRVVPLTSSTLPVVLGEVVSFAEASTHGAQEHAVVTAVNLDTGALHASLAFEDEDAAPFEDEPGGSEHTEDPVGGRTSSVLEVDLRARLKLPWEESRLLVTALVLDRASNRAAVELAPPPSEYRDPAVRDFLVAERVRVGPGRVSPAVVPGDALPHYRAVAESPAVPEKVGIALAVPRVVVYPGTCPLYGAFRLPLAKGAVVPADRRAVDEGATAVVTITLLLTGSRYAAPRFVVLRVPVFEPIEAASPPAEVSGHFALDLFAFPSILREAQTSFLYAFSGEVMAGAFPMGFVSRDKVPTRGA